MQQFVGWAKRTRAHHHLHRTLEWWARRKGAFAHPTALKIKSDLPVLVADVQLTFRLRRTQSVLQIAGACYFVASSVMSFKTFVNAA
ncbi:hypothetical protein V1292_000052 [Bradyrhizobium sp. AZCC 1719]